MCEITAARSRTTPWVRGALRILGPHVGKILEFDRWLDALAPSKNPCEEAACRGRLDWLRYLHRRDCPWGVWTCHAAAHNGHLDCLRYALDNGCPCDGSLCYWAVTGHPPTPETLECARLVRDSGCPLDVLTLSVLRQTYPDEQWG